MHTLISAALFSLLASALPQNPNDLARRAGKNSRFCSDLNSYISDNGGFDDPVSYCSAFLSIPVVSKVKTTFAKETVTVTVTQDGVAKLVTAATTTTITVTPSITEQATIHITSTDSVNTPTSTVYLPGTLCNGQPLVSSPNLKARDATVPTGMATLTDDAALSSGCSCLTISKSTSMRVITSTRTKTKLLAGTITSKPTSTAFETLQSTTTVTDTETSVTTVSTLPTTTVTVYVSQGAAPPTAYYISMGSKYLSQYQGGYLATFQDSKDSAYRFAPPTEEGNLITEDGNNIAYTDNTDPSEVNIAGYDPNNLPGTPLHCQLQVDSKSNQCGLACSTSFGNIQYSHYGLSWSVGSADIEQQQAYLDIYFPFDLGYRRTTPAVVPV